MKGLLPAVVAACVLAFTSTGNAAESPAQRSADPKATSDRQASGDQKKSADQTFATQAAAAGLAELDLAKLAREKATNDAVRQYAEHLLQDHQEANEKLKSIASEKGITLPNEPAAKHKREKDKLAKAQGAEFDKAYIEAMVKDHKEAVRDFEKQAKNGKDPQLKAYASEVLPKLQQHLQQAQQLQDSVKTDKKS